MNFRTTTRGHRGDSHGKSPNQVYDLPSTVVRQATDAAQVLRCGESVRLNKDNGASKTKNRYWNEACSGLGLPATGPYDPLTSPPGLPVLERDFRLRFRSC
jgi:hypothetical protein